MGNPKTGEKPMKNQWMTLLAIVAVVLVAIVGYAQITGTTPVQDVCTDNLGNVVDCSVIPFQTVTDETGTSVEVAGIHQYAIKDITIMAEEAFSNSWSSVAGDFELYTYGDDPTDPNVNNFTSIALSSGTGSDSSWNAADTDTQYAALLNGGSTYYDVYDPSFTFKSENYNSELGTYTYRYNDVNKVGTINELVDDTSGTYSTGVTISTAGNNVTVNNTAEAGTASFDIILKNTAGNTLLKDVVLDLPIDQSNPLEGNEFTSVTLQLKSGHDFGLPSDITNYVTNNQAIPVGDIEGGVKGVYTITFTYNTANFVTSTDTLRLELDDMGGYLGKDISMGTKATAMSYTLTRAA